MFAEDYAADGLNAPCNYSCHGVVLPFPARSICIQTSQTDLLKCPGRLEPQRKESRRAEAQLSVRALWCDIKASLTPMMLPLCVRGLWRSVVLLVLLSVLAAGGSQEEWKPRTLPRHRVHVPCLISGESNSTCRSRRCLAKMLIDKSLMSQPQEGSCTQMIYVPFMEYQTISVVSTKNHSHCSFRSAEIPGWYLFSTLTPEYSCCFCFLVFFLQDTKNLLLISRMQASLVSFQICVNLLFFFFNHLMSSL